MKFKLMLLLSMLFVANGCGHKPHRYFQGYVEGDNLFLASPFYGALIDLKVVRGQHVKKGALLFQLDSNPQQINIALATGELEQARNTLADLEKPRRLPELSSIEAQVDQTKAQVQLATLRLERYKKLYLKQAADKDTLDAAIANLQEKKQLQEQYESNLALAKLGGREDQIKAQKSQINALLAKLDQAKWELAQKTITAPASGVLFDTYFQQGEIVPAAQPVVSLLTPQSIRVEFFVPLDWMGNVHLGDEITFDCEGCAPQNSAIISYISPDAEFVPPLVYTRENNSKLIFRVKAQIKNPFSFKPGQPVTVRL